MRSLANLFRSWLDVMRVRTHVAVLLLKYPTLTIQRPSVWRYDTLRAIEIGEDVLIGPYTEIIVYSRTARSRIPGLLICGDRVFIAAGCNIRAAGGTISLGSNALIGQNVSIVAANHTVRLNEIIRDIDWDQKRTGVTIGSNCWIGAGSAVAPGVSIGNNSVIGAGSVVTKDVPENEIWLGVPARFHAKIPPRK